MVRVILFICLIISVASRAQSLSDTQQKAVNNYLELVNQLTQQVNGVGSSLVTPYKRMLDFRIKPRAVTPYRCSFSAKDYYVDEARKTGSNLGSLGTTFIAKAEAAHQAYQKIDEICKAIEIYYRLKDYESDNFKRFEELVTNIEKLVMEYDIRVKELHIESEKLYSRLQPYNANNAYHKADRLMRSQLVFEKELMDAWTFNVHEDIHTGWPVDLAQKHILDDSKKIIVLNQGGAGLQYPASMTYKSFVEGVESLQSTKRNGVDGYTYTSQQSDEHSNRVHDNLLNYYNNVCVSFYNNFIKQSSANGFRGVYYLNAVSPFGIRTTMKEIVIDITPYTDKEPLEFKIAPVNTIIPPVVFSSLSDYVQFINDGMRQINHMMNPIHDLNNSASYGKYRLRDGVNFNMEYYFRSFELPVTLYQKTIDQTKALPSAYQKPLMEQAAVLYSILTELNQWNNALLAASASKQLKKDSMDYVYGIVERYKLLADTFDVRKEKLYKDVRKIFESYKVSDAKNSWVVSGNAMLLLLDKDRDQLFRAKKFLLEDTTLTAQTQEIESMARDLLTNEYTNLTGIQKYGRSHGLCPYTPYEDLATYSRQFAEYLMKAKNKKVSSYYRHPYNELMYQYNHNLTGSYNKFAELSKVPLLQSVEQLEYFAIVPHREAPVKKAAVQAPVEEAIVIPAAVEPVVVATVIEPGQKNKSKQKGNKNDPVKPSTNVATTGVVHDTVRITDIIRIETRSQDTVYVSKVDTVYVGVPGENMMSMEGYATNNMVLLLDVSGSMNSPEKLPLLKKSVLLLMKMMRPEDQVSIVTYSGKAKVELPPTSFKEEEKIAKVIERLKSEGKTDGNAGIKLAYQIADKNYIRGGNNRIILATDGEFPIGEPTYDLVKKFASEDIFITVFNFGKSTMSSKSLQQLVTLGKGNYEYISRENVDVKLITEAKAKKKK